MPVLRTVCARVEEKGNLLPFPFGLRPKGNGAFWIKLV